MEALDNLRLIVDIEADGFLEDVTKLHCISVITDDGEQRWHFTDNDYPARTGSLDDGIALIEKAGQDGKLIMHNGIGYDLPVIQKLYPDFKYKPATVVDTMLVAGVFWPKDIRLDIDAAYNRKHSTPFPSKLTGRNSLEAWGYRMGTQKDDYFTRKAARVGEDHVFDEWDPEMSEYCDIDVDVTLGLWKRCKAKMSKRDRLDDLRLEHDFKFIMCGMERNGVEFRADAAEALYREIAGEREDLRQALVDLYKPWYSPEVARGKHVVATPKASRKFNGQQYTKGAPYTKVKLNVFNPTSRSMIADRLMKVQGWTPKVFTPGGAPQIDDQVLTDLPYPEAATLARYFLLDKRIGQISDGKKGWLKQVKPDGRVYGRIDTLGAVTRRCTHASPNLAQVPKVGTVYGAECRALFGSDCMLGADLSGIELRGLAHYLHPYDGGSYAEAVVSGNQEDESDPHSLNSKALGFDPHVEYTVNGKQATGRDIAKRFI